jgi:BirA family biotin operon repressor/biotin-[acetyl-CoA-carboxylase] ligase
VRLGEPRIEVASTTSTQALLDPSLPEGALAVADVQTAGRGRLGRPWVAPAGTAVLASVLLKPPPGRPLPQLSLVAGVAVAEAIERLSTLPARIKWPNDVLLADEKVAGILAEAREGAVVLGIGVNVDQAREQLPPGAASLRTATGRRWSREAVLDALLDTLGERYEQWLAGGLAAVHGELARRDALRDTRVTVDGAPGTARGIDRDGRLQVELDAGGRRVVESGEVRVARRGPATAPA